MRLTDGLVSFDLYERILKGEKERDQPSLAHAELKLSGLVKRDSNGLLIPRNRIYQRLFDLEWVRKTRPKQEVRRYRRLAFAAAAVLVLGLIGGGAYYKTVVVPTEGQLAASDAQLAARRALEGLRVTLTYDSRRGWTEVGLPTQDTLAALQRAVPDLVTLSKAPDVRGLSLDLSEVPAVDLNILAPLTELRRLNLMGTKLIDLGPLAKLIGLQDLDIAHTLVTNLAPLASVRNLRRLNASMTAISDLAPLSGLANLESLDVSGTQVKDLSHLAKLTKLQQLDVSNTPVSNLAPLAGLTRLKELNVSRTKVVNLSPLEGLTNLRTLALDGLGDIEFNAGRIPNLKILRDPAARNTATVYKPGETFRDCPQCPQMVVVPAGSFEMGSPPGEEGHQRDEEPLHPVKISQPFAVSKYEVRFDEWLPCVQAGVCKALPDEGWGRGARPVINVSWEEAKRYVEWLSRKAGHSYSLLTEAEWEYAARAGTKGPRYWKEDEKPCTYASIYDTQGKAAYDLPWEGFGCDDGYPETAPVGMFLPNQFGLHDMLGNVWEWTEDCYQDSYSGNLAEGTARDCGSRVVRGGSWYNEPQIVRSAIRNRDSPVNRFFVLGFRVARTLIP